MQAQESSIMKINKYELFIYCGVDEYERKKKQKILLSVEIYFSILPKASMTDNVKDTICYHDVCSRLKEFNSKTFKTIEALTYKIFTFLRSIYQPHHLRLQVDKFPNIKNLKGSVSFSIGNVAEEGKVEYTRCS